jgi:hypothetical protein
VFCFHIAHIIIIIIIIIAYATDDSKYEQIERTKMDGASEEKCTQILSG